MRKCLVVGGAGFVGRQLCQSLHELGHKVFIVGRSSQPEDVPGEWLRADITNLESLESALNGLSPDVIYHLASLPGDTGDPREMTRVNVVGLCNLLILARETKVSRFVLSGSISSYEWYPGTIFAPPDYMPVDEQHPTRPRDMYASTKRMQEIMALTFYHQYELPVAVLRITAVVGPGGRGGGRGYRVLAEQMKEGKRAQIPFFDMDEVGHFVDIRDVARLHIVVSEHPSAVGEIFNCCGPSPTRGDQFADILKRCVPRMKVEAGFPWSMAQGKELSFDMSKAKRMLQFTPQYDIEASIMSIWDWVCAGGLDEVSGGSHESYGVGVKS